MKMFYRYVDTESGGYYLDVDGDMTPSGITTISVDLIEYRVVKETPKGFWIQEYLGPFWSSDKKWISNHSKFAWDTKEKALKSFKLRKKSQIKIYNKRLNSAKTALKMAEEGLPERSIRQFSDWL